jgi:hypothetical protein
VVETVGRFSRDSVQLPQELLILVAVVEGDVIQGLHLVAQAAQVLLLSKSPTQLLALFLVGLILVTTLPTMTMDFR